MARFWRLLSNLVHRTRIERDLDEELRAAFELLVDEKVRSGVPSNEARRAARLELGSLDSLKDQVRDARAGIGLETLLQDIHYACRSLRRAPGFTAVAAVTLALSIGANMAMFSIVDGVLLRTLPYADADRLVRVYQANPVQKAADGLISAPDFEDWRVQTRSFAAMAAYAQAPAILTGRGDPFELESAFVTGDFFGVLGTAAQIGRPLLEDDTRKAVGNAVISDRLWRTRFGADQEVIGSAILLWGHPFTVVGVVPSTFRFPTPDTDVWAPHSVLSEDIVGPRVRNQRTLEGVARLAEGVSLEQARAELNAVSARLALAHPVTNAGWSAATVVPLRMTILGAVDRALMVVFAVVGFILLIGCANLANLLLARGAARSREMAVRTALGAGRMRLVRQLLTESLVLGLLGGVLGLVLAVVAVDTVLALSGQTLPRVEDVRIDGRVIGFGLLLVLVTGLLSGLFPALRTADAAPGHDLKSGRGVIGRGLRLRSALVVAEIGLAVVLTISAGLMARSFLALRSVDAGFDSDGLLAVTMQFNIANVRAPDIGRHIVQRREEFIERFAALAGVASVGSITNLPLEGRCRDYLEFTHQNGSRAVDGGVFRADNCLISTGYLRTMRIPVLRGEPLPNEWARGAPVPFLVNETAALRFWPGQDPLGQMIRGNYGGDAVVVGVVGDVRQLGLRDAAPPTVYYHQRVGPRAPDHIHPSRGGRPSDAGRADPPGHQGTGSSSTDPSH
jgi:predicted permease